MSPAAPPPSAPPIVLAGGAGYRAEIDGLRALAVLSTILFHAGVRSFEGGYIGVDMFFVISGYLITRGIEEELRAGHFDLSSFYERRARRIFPALFVVMLAGLPLAWRWLLPLELKDFARTLASTSTFVSNFYFWHTSPWRDGGYFEGEAEFKPLLHTWSLAVEEQFYLLFPCFLLMAWTWARRWILWGLGISIIAGVVASQVGSQLKPSGTFYLLPTRCWELLIGAFLAWPSVRQGLDGWPQRWRVAGSWLGLTLFAGTMASVSKKTGFPGFWALGPTLGAGLLITCADGRTCIGKLLRLPALTRIGLLSYSLYLWHPLLFAFARARHADEPSALEFAALMLLSIGLAYLTWRYVETPFRDRHRTRRASIVALAIGGAFGFVGVGIWGSAADGWPGRYTPTEQALIEQGARSYRDSLAVYGLRKCFIDYDQTPETLQREHCVALADGRQGRAILFGDSEAAHWRTGLDAALQPAGYAIQQWTGTSCRAINYANNSRRCDDFYRQFVEKVLPTLTSRDLVIVASRWIGLFNDQGPRALEHGLEQLFRALAASSAKVAVIANTPEFAAAPQHLIVKHRLATLDSVSLPSVDVEPVNAIIRRQASAFGIPMLEPARILCASTTDGRCTVMAQRVLYYLDSGHLSPEGSRYVMTRLMEEQQGILLRH